MTSPMHPTHEYRHWAAVSAMGLENYLSFCYNILESKSLFLVNIVNLTTVIIKIIALVRVIEMF